MPGVTRASSPPAPRERRVVDRIVQRPQPSANRLRPPLVSEVRRQHTHGRQRQMDVGSGKTQAEPTLPG